LKFSGSKEIVAKNASAIIVIAFVMLFLNDFFLDAKLSILWNFTLKCALGISLAVLQLIGKRKVIYTILRLAVLVVVFVALIKTEFTFELSSRIYLLFRQLNMACFMLHI